MLIHTHLDTLIKNCKFNSSQCNRRDHQGTAAQINQQ